MKVVLEAAARSEMWEAAQFYEDCREGLGLEFLDAVEQALERIKRQPLLGSPLKASFRRVFLHRFPYALVYAVEEDITFVAAVMHLKRKPGYWEERHRRR
jgi:hypothetical protein